MILFAKLCYSPIGKASRNADILHKLYSTSFLLVAFCHFFLCSFYLLGYKTHLSSKAGCSPATWSEVQICFFCLTNGYVLEVFNLNIQLRAITDLDFLLPRYFTLLCFWHNQFKKLLFTIPSAVSYKKKILQSPVAWVFVLMSTL